MTNLRPRRLSRAARIACVVVLGLGLGLADSASAAVIYDFSLPQNGAVGAFNVQLSFPTFPLVSGLQVIPLNSPSVISLSSGTPIDPALSVIGLDVLGGSTRFGINLETGGGGTVLFTTIYPADFFVFGRTPTETGTFLSTAGLVVSDLQLDTVAPTATLNVSDTTIPEPSTLPLLFVGLLGIAVARRRRTHLS